MDAMTFLTIIGTVASIFGAAISIWQARSSKDAAKASQIAAQKAKDVRDQLIAQRKTSDLSELMTVCKKAQKSIGKFGLASSTSNLVGVNPIKEAEDVQEFLVLLKENRAFWGNAATNKADQFCDELSANLDKFAQSKSEDDLRTHGKKLSIQLMDITANIKSLLDTKIEKVS